MRGGGEAITYVCMYALTYVRTCVCTCTSRTYMYVHPGVIRLLLPPYTERFASAVRSETSENRGHQPEEPENETSLFFSLRLLLPWALPGSM